MSGPHLAGYHRSGAEALLDLCERNCARLMRVGDASGGCPDSAERAPRPPVSPSTRAAIERAVAAHESARAIASRFGVHASTVRRIASRAK
jgi:DNA invertase Pin-like site-specific DNA recombinase